MKVAEVVGKVALSSWHPALSGATWKLAVPLSHEDDAKELNQRGEAIVVFDELGAGQGARIAVSDGAEAAAPFYPETKPIDAYNAAILDRIEVGL